MMAERNLGKAKYTQPWPWDGEAYNGNMSVTTTQAVKHGMLTHADVHEVMTMQRRTKVTTICSESLQIW